MDRLAAVFQHIRQHLPQPRLFVFRQVALLFLFPELLDPAGRVRSGLAQAPVFGQVEELREHRGGAVGLIGRVAHSVMEGDDIGAGNLGNLQGAEAGAGSDGG